MNNKKDLDDAVDRIPYNGKGTNTGRALREVVKNAFVPENGDRPDVQNQVLFFVKSFFLNLAKS